MIDFGREVRKASERILPYIRETPLEYSHKLSELTDAPVYVKLENLQHTGSFKTRGALNKLLSLSMGQREKGVVAASTGNHGAAVSYGLSQLGAKGIVFVPENAKPTKIEGIRRYGAEVKAHGNDGVITETHARQYAEEHDMAFISPYNDAQVIAGQGTIASELVKQLETLDVVFVSVGGGGLISGIAGFLKSLNSNVTVVGCTPDQAPIMYESIRQGHIVTLPNLPTLSDGTAGGLEPGAITFNLCQALVDVHVLVTEAEIRHAMLTFMEAHHMMIEGAAGVAIAGCLKLKEQFRGLNSAVIICGGNIGLDSLKNLLDGPLL